MEHPDDETQGSKRPGAKNRVIPYPHRSGHDMEEILHANDNLNEG